MHNESASASAIHCGAVSSGREANGKLEISTRVVTTKNWWVSLCRELGSSKHFFGSLPLSRVVACKTHPITCRE